MSIAVFASELCPMTRKVLLALLLVLAGGRVSPAAAPPPSVVLFYTDDQGTLDAGCYGSDDLYTPHMDSLAASGVRFTQFYAHTVCCPSRALVMTGRHPQRSGVTRWVQSQMSKPGINMALSEVTLGEMFRTAGYRTGLFGKWHLGAAATNGPTRQGFDEFFGIRNGFIDNFNHYYLHREGFHDLYRGTEAVRHDGEYFPDLTTAEALRFLDENHTRPFFMVVSFNIPHYPEQPDPEFVARYADMSMPRQTYAQTVSTVDDRIGQVLRKLDELGVREETVVVFLSDNGHSEETNSIQVENHNSGLPKGHNYGANGGGGNTGKWRGSKGNFFEGGIRVPAIVSYAKKLPQGVVRDQVASALDLLPTLADLCEIPLPDVELDGGSLVPMMRSAAVPTHHEVLHWQWFDYWAVRRGDWKLLTGYGEKDLFLAHLAGPEPERKNHALEQPERVQELLRLHENWLAAVTPTPAQAELQSWLGQSGLDHGEVRPWEELQPSSGDAFRAKEVIYFKLGAWPASGHLSFPRLNNPNRRVYLLGDPEETGLKLTQSPQTWTVHLPEQLPPGAFPCCVFEVVGEPYLPVEPRVILQAADGRVTLAAHDAVTHGEKLFYEPQPHKNTLGYWVVVTDWAEWHVDIREPGTFDVDILQGCGKRHGGSDVDFILGKSRMTFQVEDTGNFQNFKQRRVGRLHVDEPGRYRLEVRPQNIARKAVMDLRKVELVPVPAAADEK